ncbi:LacI family DNA-binding transcriptional regulator [Nakamurella sp. YIM 132087]|uniref:LacI family DNA-binding transcriptional regulator n=1 Tax=Nakamurella alba TaxID=2665158 RepID=A0A7K1FS17_9ACTN|nr:LacI family DNA-binding transcriptional regulator [Nakamurella alba]MTD16936.1 LacI family DNA-binding transcriptional regulator [Nakamurella alba]
MATMREVALLAGVSTKTVSRVVNDDRYISAGVRERVEQAIAELRYVPNPLARTFRSGRDTAIGVAVPDLADPFFAAIVRTVEHAARERGTVVLVTSVGEDPTEEQPAVEALLRRQISGLVLIPTGSDHTYLRQWADQVGIVFVDRPPGRLAADSVIEDDRSGAIASVDRLVANGHRRIAFLARDRQVVTVRRRQEGYRAALAGAGLPLDADLEIFYEDRGLAADVAVPELLGRVDPPTAVFCANSLTAVDVVPVLHRIGRTDLAVVSFGDFPMADSLRPSVTAVDQIPDSLGRAAVERLFRRIDDPTARLGRLVVLPVSLIVRESSEIPGPAAGPA